MEHIKLSENEIAQMERTLELLVENAKTCRALFNHYKGEEFKNRLAYEAYANTADKLREDLLQLEFELKKAVYNACQV